VSYALRNHHQKNQTTWWWSKGLPPLLAVRTI